MRPSIFERLELWMVEWFHLNGKQANITKTGNLSQLCDFIIIINNYFFSVGKYVENIVKIILWKKFHDRIHN